MRKGFIVALTMTAVTFVGFSPAAYSNQAKDSCAPKGKQETRHQPKQSKGKGYECKPAPKPQQVRNEVNNSVTVSPRITTTDVNINDVRQGQGQDQQQKQGQQQGQQQVASADNRGNNQSVNVEAQRVVPGTIVAAYHQGPEGAQVYDQRYWGCLTPQEISNILDDVLNLPAANVRDASTKGESGTSIVTISAYRDAKSSGGIPVVRDDGMVNGTAVGIIKVRAIDHKSDEADATFNRDDAALSAYDNGFRSDEYELVNCQFMSSVTNGTSVVNQGQGIDIGSSGLLSGIPVLGSIAGGKMNGKAMTFSAQKRYDRYVIVKKGAGSLDLNAVFMKICVKEQPKAEVPPPAPAKKGIKMLEK